MMVRIEVLDSELQNDWSCDNVDKVYVYDGKYSILFLGYVVFALSNLMLDKAKLTVIFLKPISDDSAGSGIFVKFVTFLSKHFKKVAITFTGPDNTAPVIQIWCGRMKPVIQSSDTSLTLRFVRSVGYVKGFKLKYTETRGAYLCCFLAVELSQMLKVVVVICPALKIFQLNVSIM